MLRSNDEKDVSDMTSEEVAARAYEFFGPHPIIIKKAVDEGHKITSSLFELTREHKEVYTSSGGGSLAGIAANYFGFTVHLYEVKNEGVILYKKHSVNPGSHSQYFETYLLGFNEESEKYKEIKSQLESIAAMGDQD